MAAVNEKAPTHASVLDGGEVEAQPERGITMNGGTRGADKRKRALFTRFGIQVFFMIALLAFVCAATVGVFQIKKDVEIYLDEVNGVATTHSSIAARDVDRDVLFTSASDLSLDITNVKAARYNNETSVDCNSSMAATSGANSASTITAPLTAPLGTITLTVTISTTTDTITTVTAGTATPEQTTVKSTGAITAPGPVSSGTCVPITLTITLSQVSPVSSGASQATTTVSLTTMFTTITATSTQFVAGASLGDNSASSPVSATLAPTVLTSAVPTSNNTSDVSPVGTTLPAPVINSSSISFTLSGSGWTSSIPANTTYAMPTGPSATTIMPSYATTSGGGSASGGYSDGVSCGSYAAMLLATAVLLLI